MSRQCPPDPLPVLLTRPAAGNARFAAMLGGRVIRSPLSEPRYLPAELPRAAAAIFTSATAIAALGGARPAPRAWCVGARTARVAEAAGFEARSADGDAEALIAAILAAREPGPLLHPHGRETRGDVAARLTAAGISTTGVVVYDMVPQPLTPEARAALAGRVIVPLFSPAAARRFLAETAPRQAIFACLSPAVAAELPAASPVHVAARPDAAAMADLVRTLQSLETSSPQS